QLRGGRGCLCDARRDFGQGAGGPAPPARRQARRAALGRAIVRALPGRRPLLLRSELRLLVGPDGPRIPGLRARRRRALGAGREAAVEAMRKTVAALPPGPEATLSAFGLAVHPPAPSPKPVTFTHTGDPTQAQALIGRTTFGGTSGIRERRALSLAANMLQ